MYLIVGLGNPGSKYCGTRHNIGFEVIDYMAKLCDIRVSKLKHKALLGEGILNGEKVILAKPQTYMNNSGESIREMKEWYKIDSEYIIIIYDDISLPTGRLRIRRKGSAGGHNGMKSIIYQLNTDIFPRIKIGIGQPNHSDYELMDYVLGRFSKDDEKDMIKSIKDAAQAVGTIIQSGTDVAMNKFN